MSQRNDAIRPILAATVLSLLISACGGAGAHVDKQFERPAVIRFGASAAELERALEGQCTQRQLRTDDPVFLPNVRKGQQWQIDCEGFQFFGQGRHVEFVLRDDRLVMVWLMVTDAEAPTMIDVMTRAYGAPTERNAAYVTFERDRATARPGATDRRKSCSGPKNSTPTSRVFTPPCCRADARKRVSDRGKVAVRVSPGAWLPLAIAHTAVRHCRPSSVRAAMRSAVPNPSLNAEWSSLPR